MPLETIRAAIVAKLKTIPGIRPVHSYERFAQGAKEFRELYADGNRILGWHVRRVASREIYVGIDDGLLQTDHEWIIRGFHGLDDAAASEITFDALIELIRYAFRADDDLGGVVHTCSTDEAAGIQVLDSGPVMFAGVLCHATTLTLVTRAIS